ncbi:MAG TPA: L,D-transpeptidase family protein [Candidatus Saccharimonadales bacterium]|nr:L,D-transpeptidase family protein [Candidatus Saccharimonadales bacterium]
MSQSRFIKFITVSSFIVGAIFMAANLFLSSAYADRVLPGIHLAGIDLSGMRGSQVRAAASRVVAEQNSIKLSVDNQNFDIHAADVDLTTDPVAIASEAIKTNQKPWLPILGFVQPPKQLGLRYQVDGEKVQNLLQTILPKFSVAPTDATITVDNGRPTIQPGANGKAVDPNQAHSLLTDALGLGATSLHLDSAPVAPVLTPENLQPIVAQIKQRMKMTIILSYQGKKFQPDAATIGSWLGAAEGDNGQPILVAKPDQIKKYLASVSKSVDIKPKDKVINTVNGSVQSTTEGTNGLRLDQDTLTTSLAGRVLADQSLKTEVPTQVLAFKTIYNRTYNLDFGKYIEVNLSMQHLWVYQDHQVVMDTPITSGSTGTGHPTVQGLFAVYTKERNRWLDGRPLGYNYDVYVQYWMPFYADYGLHDATWRHSFGGPDYYYGGSHGCVNMPPPSAAWLYGWVDVGTPVWIHG